MDGFNPWAKHTLIVAGVAGLSTAVGTIGHELAISAFALSPWGQAAAIGVSFALGFIAKSPYFKGSK